MIDNTLKWTLKVGSHDGDKDTNHLIVMCMSEGDFYEYMLGMMGFYPYPPKTIAVISIGTWYVPSTHLYGDDARNVLNVDFDDFDPCKYGDFDYDSVSERYFSGEDKSDDVFRQKIDEGSEIQYEIKAMDFNDAERIVRFIDDQIKKHIQTFIIHCKAGVSRSQGVVKYIKDTYSPYFDIGTRKNNPCVTPNVHVVRMLKRTAMNVLEI